MYREILKALDIFTGKGALISSYLKGKTLEECAGTAAAVAALNTAAFGPMEEDITAGKIRAVML